MNYICLAMQTKTHIHFLVLIFGYCVVLFHGAIPHCHISETHGKGHVHSHHHHSNHGDHSQDGHSKESNHEALSHDDGLHNGYVKSNTTGYVLPVLPAESFPDYFQFAVPLSANDRVFTVSHQSQRVRRGLFAAHALRGPPAC